MEWDGFDGFHWDPGVLDGILVSCCSCVEIGFGMGFGMDGRGAHCMVGWVHLVGCIG